MLVEERIKYMELPSVEARKQGWAGYNPTRPGHPEDQAQEFLDRKNKPRLKIEELTLFVAVDEFGDEGIAAAFFSDRGWLPMIAADSARVESLRTIAEKMSLEQQSVLREIKFSTKMVVKTFDKGQVS